MHVTQNIDTLDLKTGLREEKSLAAHGDLRKAHCYKCKEEVPIEEFFDAVEHNEILKCKKKGCYTGLIKPKVVFYGE